MNSICDKKTIEKCKKIMAFNYYEMNDFSFKLALKYDHRTFCEYYLSLLKNIIIMKKHNASLIVNFLIILLNHNI